MLATLLAAALAAVPVADAPPSGAADVAADAAEVDALSRRLVATGRVRLRLGDLHLAADRVLFEQATGMATAEGSVLLAEGALAASADRVLLNVSDGSLTIERAALFEKPGVSAAVAVETGSAAALEALGQNALSLRGDRLERLGRRRYAVSGLSFTPCACAGARADWRIDAASADIELSERAVLYWPVFRVLDVPVFALPAVVLPLSDRRSGLLLPRVTYSAARNGLAIEQPLFVTLGESRDLTFIPGYLGLLLGPEREGVRQGMRGPRLGAEYRYALAERWDGRVVASAGLDANHDLVVGKPEAPRGWRWELSSTHRRDGEAVGERLDLALVSDANLVVDNAGDLFAREEAYRRSSGALYLTSGGSFGFLEAQVFQDLRASPSPGAPRPLFGPGAPPLQARAPSLGFAVPVRESGPWRGEFAGSVSRIGSGSAPEVLRLDGGPRVAASVAIGQYVSLDAQAAYRQTAWLVDGEATATRGYPLLALSAATAVDRVFEGASRWRHAVEPRADLRFVPAVFGAAPDYTYDEVEGALGSGPSRRLQAVGAIATRLDAAGDGGARTVAELELGQGYDVFAARPADAFGRLAVALGPLRAGARARLDVASGTFVAFAGDAALEGGPGAVYARYEHLAASGTDRMRAGVDALFGAPAAAAAAYDLAVAGFRWSPRAWITLAAEAVTHPPTLSLLQQTASVVVRSACDCWHLDVRALWRPGLPFPEFGVGLTLERLGTLGT